MPPGTDVCLQSCYQRQTPPQPPSTGLMPATEYQDMNSIGPSTADSHNFLSSVTPNMLVLNQFDSSMVGDNCQRDYPAAAFPRGFLGTRGSDDYQLHSCDRVPVVPCKESVSGRNSDTSENDAPDINTAGGLIAPIMYYARSRTCSDHSSPMASTYASPMAVLPSQQCSEPSTPQSAMSSVLPVSVWVTSPASTDDMFENISPFIPPTAPSTPVSPTAGRSSARAEFVPMSPTPIRTHRAKIRKSQCNRHRGRYFNGDCGKLCRLPKVYSKADNSFKCNKCGQRFKRQEHLKRHDRIHTGERPFECKIPKCGKAFSRGDNFKEHLRTHLKQGGRNLYVPGLKI